MGKQTAQSDIFFTDYLCKRLPLFIIINEKCFILGGVKMASKEYTRVMVAVDGSKTSEIAFKKAVDIVARNQGKLYIAHIVDTRTLQVFPQYERPLNGSDFLNQQSNAAKQTLDKYKEWAEQRDVTDIEIIIKNGSPRTELADVLPEEYEIDLLILGATGLNAIERAFVGSVSQYVVRNASSDVLIVRTDDSVDNEPIE